LSIQAHHQLNNPSPSTGWCALSFRLMTDKPKVMAMLFIELKHETILICQSIKKWKHISKKTRVARFPKKHDAHMLPVSHRHGAGAVHDASRQLPVFCWFTVQKRSPPVATTCCCPSLQTPLLCSVSLLASKKDTVQLDLNKTWSYEIRLFLVLSRGDFAQGSALSTADIELNLQRFFLFRRLVAADCQFIKRKEQSKTWRQNAAD
jgi:hypothetical protein